MYRGLQSFAFVATLIATIGLGQEPTPAHIAIDLGKVIGPYEPIYSWFGYDEANYTTAANGRKLLGELHDLSPVPVNIRVHHLLTSGNGIPELKWSSTDVYSEDKAGKPLYSFTILDGIFDAFQAAGVRPMVELGFMPEALAADLPDRHEPYQVHYPHSTISGKSNNPPRDYRKWSELVRIVTAHLVERYGHDNVLQWYFEVWNEPDIDYWHASEQDYFKLYDFAVQGVRAALPGARVGGPASTSPGSPKAYSFLKLFLDHVDTGHSLADGGAVPLDFISFHAKGSPTIVEGRVTMGIQRELTDVDHGFQLISTYPRLHKLPIILSEADPEGCAACSSKVNPANNYRNGTLYPAYTAAAYKRLFALRDKYEVNLISMLSWSFEFEDHEFFEGFRSLATNGVDKPILNFFRMAGLMGGARVSVISDRAIPLEEIVTGGVRQRPDVDALATLGKRQAEVMLWNYHDAAEAAPGSSVDLMVEGLPASVKEVLLANYRIDDTYSNAYTFWLAMGSPQHPDAAQLAQLQARSGLELIGSPVTAKVVAGTLRIQTEMPRQSVSLVKLTW